MRRIALVMLLLLAFTTTAFGAPKNIILMIGDGMGVAQVAAARISSGRPGSRLAMDGMPVTGFVTTYSANALITDSAAAATAFSSGVKTNNGVLGQTPAGKKVRTILEAARDAGKSTGLVTNDVMTGATPAAFAAHVPDRGQSDEIASDYLSSRVDVLFGDGKGSFEPRLRKDHRDLIAEASKKGYAVVRSRADLGSAKGTKLLGFFAPDESGTLAALADKAISALSKTNKGFFAMIEDGMIDHAGHSNDFSYCVKQALEFDKAVARALVFAKKDGNTLVIVTADHETGGLTLLTDDKGKLKGAWSSGGHTAVAVPLYAFGPDAGKFAGLIDNTEIAKRMAGIWGVKIGL